MVATRSRSQSEEHLNMTNVPPCQSDNTNNHDASHTEAKETPTAHQLLGQHLPTRSHLGTLEFQNENSLETLEQLLQRRFENSHREKDLNDGPIQPETSTEQEKLPETKEDEPTDVRMNAAKQNSKPNWMTLHSN